MNLPQVSITLPVACHVEIPAALRITVKAEFCARLFLTAVVKPFASIPDSTSTWPEEVVRKDGLERYANADSVFPFGNGRLASAATSLSSDGLALGTICPPAGNPEAPQIYKS
jgi:hypothetical protein